MNLLISFLVGRHLISYVSNVRIDIMSLITKLFANSVLLCLKIGELIYGNCVKEINTITISAMQNGITATEVHYRTNYKVVIKKCTIQLVLNPIK